MTDDLRQRSPRGEHPSKETLLPGERLALSGTRSDNRAGSPAAWRLTAGAVDLYAELCEGERVMWRDHLFTVDEGALLWPFHAPENLRLVGAPRGEASLQTLAPADLRATPDMAAEVDAWLLRLHATLEYYAPVVDFGDHLLGPGESFRLKPGERLLGAAGILWVRFHNGGVVFLDGAAVVAGDEPRDVPLSPRTWLTALVEVELAVYRTLDLGSDLADAVQRFHKTAADLLWFYLDTTYRAEQDRLMAKASVVSRERRDLLSRFSTVTGQRAFGDGEAREPLEAVMRRIGAEFRVEIELPGPELSGVSLEQRIDAICRGSRLRRRPVILRPGWQNYETAAPMLAFRKAGQSPVALLPSRRGDLRLWDPYGHKAGRRKITRTLAAEIDPKAYSFYRTLPDRPLGTLDLLRFVADVCRRDLERIVAFGVLGTVMAMLVPIATTFIIDTAIPSHQRDQLYAVGFGLVIAAGAAFSFKICENIALLRAEGKVTQALQPALLDRLLRMPNTFFREYSAGDLAERAKTMDLIQERLAGGAMSALLAGVFSLLNFTIMFYLAPTAALVAFLLITVLIATLLLTARHQYGGWKENRRLRGDLASLVLQILSGIRRVRFTGAEDRMFVHWGNLEMRLRRTFNACYNTETFFLAFSGAFHVFSFAVLFAVLAALPRGELSTGGFLAFIAAFSVTLTGVTAMSKALLALVELAPLKGRIKPILQSVPEDARRKSHPGILSGDLEVNELCFSYGKGMPPVLQGLSLAVEPGQYVAIVGPSGCGKSTLLRLILGFEQPESGGIYLDGKDLSGLDPRGVRRQMGVVLQNDRLMDASIYDNIRGTHDITVTDAWRAARMCGLEDEIAAMPLAMRTVISSEGSDLSGGQIQRLLIARALALRPRFLLLDEATSALDNRTQSVVMKSLERLRITRIAIAHRLTTVKEADRIFVINEGRIVESGTYDELMAAQGFFADLVRRQLH